MSAPILKSAEQIEAMREAGRVTARALKHLEEVVAPGVDTLTLDKAVEEVIVAAGGVPAFLGYPSATLGVADFPASICASINEEVVHGIPSADRILREGDIISIDVGVILNGWFGDAARTFPVGKISRKASRLLKVTESSLREAISVLKPGVKLRRVSAAVQETAEASGFSVVRKFVGHGIGREMHEAPQVPNYVTRVFGDGGRRLDAGTVLAIEPMVNSGVSDVRVKPDGWTVITKDHSLSAHFEDTVAIGPTGPIVLTNL